MSADITSAENALAIPQGYKQTEVGIIPEDWEVVNFGDIVKYTKGYPFKSREYTDSGLRVIRVSDTSFSTIKNDHPIYVSHESKQRYKKWELNNGNIIFTTVGSKPPMYDSLVGKAILVKKEHTGYLLNQNAVLIKANNKTKNFPNLLINHFRTERYIDHIEQIYRGNANQASITLDSLFSFKLPFPVEPKEQTAIANALSDVDALLCELEKLIAKKQAIKTATMQQLLTGKTRLPAFAFYRELVNEGSLHEELVHTASPHNTTNHTENTLKGQPKGTKPSEIGEIPEDWEVKSLDDISLIPMQNGLFYEPARKGKGIPLINVSDMYSAAPISVESLELFDATKSERKTFNVIEGDIFFTRSSIVPSGIAFCNIYPSTNKESVFDSHLIKVRVNPHIADYRYIYLNCLSTHSRKHLIANAKTATMTTIDQRAIKNCPVLLPSIKEQTAIATILSDMDSEIQALTQRLAKTRQIKQGMMQALLTGKIRLPFEKNAAEVAQ